MLTVVAGFFCFHVLSVPGRNYFVTRTQMQFDLRMLKFFRIGQGGRLDLVAESFKVLTHANVVAVERIHQFQFTIPDKASIPRQLQLSIDFEF